MLSNWLQPLETGQFSNFKRLDNNHFGKNIVIHSNRLPSLKNVKVALLTIDSHSGDRIRQALYSMSFPFKRYKIADLGNTRKAEIPFLIPLIGELLAGDILPIVVSPDPSHALALFKAYQNKKQLVNITWVSDRIPLKPKGKRTDGFINRMVHSRKPGLFNLGLIGYQSHYTPSSVINFMNDRNWDAQRLGHIRNNLEHAEPIIRDGDMLCFNPSAIRQSDLPAQLYPSPSGLSQEEACQIARYAGLSDKLSAFGCFGFDQSLDDFGQSAEAIAQLIWYFLDGYFKRHKDYPASVNGLVEYIVEGKKDGQALTFWKSKKSGRWWIQVPVKIKKKQYRHRLIPCSYQDYQEASSYDLPDRLINAFQRFS